MTSPVVGSLMSRGKINLSVVFRQYEDGTIVAECLEIPGCISQGSTEQEAKANIPDAIDGCLAVMMEDLIAATSKQQVAEDLSASEWKEVFNVVPPHLLATQVLGD